MTFTSSINNKDIPFGSAGDCYSSADCPQGQFSINLSGTGLIVSPNTTWVSQGSHASQRLARLQVKDFCHRSTDQSVIFMFKEISRSMNYASNCYS